MHYKKEYSTPSEPNPQLVHSYAQTFIQRKDCYARQVKNGLYICVKHSLSHSLLEAHIRGSITLGAYALDHNSMGSWICLDADDDNAFTSLQLLSTKLMHKGVLSYTESSRRGGHLWLFTRRNSGQVLRRFAKQLVKTYALPDLEIYPKQDQLSTGPGSLVRLPLGIHRKSGRRYHFINPDGSPLAPSIREQVAILSNPIRVPQAFIDKLANAYEDPVVNPPKPKPFDIKHMNGNTLSERLKAAISVRDFVSRYVVLDERLKGFCPFHEDKVKSFQVHSDKNFWHCYAGCGGGSIIDFAMKWRAMNGQDPSFTATISDMAQQFFT